MVLKNFLLLVIWLALLPAGCAAQPAATQTTNEAVVAETDAAIEPPSSAPAGPVDFNVFAAASLTAAFSEIGEKFEAAHPGVTVVFNFAGSQQLAQQVNEGAPADVFASANDHQMNVVIEAGGVVSGTQQTFVKNRLVAIFPEDNPPDLTELKDLAKPNLKLVLAAREVPVGQYSLDFLDKAAADPRFGTTYKEAVLKNVVSYEDNVKTVLTKVALGEADAGIVYTSDVTGEDADKVGQLEIPDELNVTVSYPIAAVKESENRELAQAFIDLVLASEGQDILAKYGFIPVK
jgi:molybdate transport system substrate-binding protein